MGAHRRCKGMSVDDGPCSECGAKVSMSCRAVSVCQHFLRLPARLLCPWGFKGEKAGNSPKQR